MILHTRKIFYSSSSYKYHTVFLERMLFSWDICDNFCTIRKSYLSDFSLCWVRFLWRHYRHLDTYTSLKRSRNIDRTVTFERIDTKHQRRGFWFLYVWCSSFLNQLCNCRHSTISVGKKRNGLYSPLMGMIQVLFSLFAVVCIDWGGDCKGKS